MTEPRAGAVTCPCGATLARWFLLTLPVPQCIACGRRVEIPEPTPDTNETAP